MGNPNFLTSTDDELRRKYPTIKTGRIFCDLGETLALVEALSVAETETDIDKIGEKFCRQNGVTRAGVLMTVTSPEGNFTKPAYIHNMKEYTDTYISEGIMSIDPIRHRSKQELLPIAWGMEQHFIDPSPSERRLLSFMSDWGRPKVIALPLHAPDSHSIFAIKIYDSTEDFNKRLGELALKAQIFGVNFHDAIRRLSRERSSPPLPPPPRLTGRETECLTWAAAGKTAWEISCILRACLTTVSVADSSE